MPVLSTTKTYLDGNILIETDLDGLKNSWETFFNVTKLDQQNFQAGGLTGSNFANATVGTGSIGAGAVTNLKIVDASVTLPKRVLNYAIANNVVSYSGPQTLARLNIVTLTCSGTRPVLLVGSGEQGAFGVAPSGYISWGGISIGITLSLVGNGLPQQIGTASLPARSDPMSIPPSAIRAIAFPSAGAQSWSLSASMSGSSAFCSYSGALIAIEL